MDNRRQRLLALMVEHNRLSNMWPFGDGPETHRQQQKITAELARLKHEIDQLTNADD